MKTIRIDKKTTKNQPDFFPTKTGTNNFFVDEVDKFKSVIPETEKEYANVEAEAGESMLTVDGQFFKIQGKKHSQGGTPLSLQEGDFIFSQKLKVKGKEIKDLHPWANEKKKYSFSDLAKKYGNKLNNYKTLEVEGDDLEQSTAKLMQQNIGKKLSEVAVMQESEKGFPEGTPDFSKSFMQVGGLIPYTSSNTPSGSTTPTGLSSLYNRQIESDRNRLQRYGIGINGLDNKEVQNKLYENVLSQDPAELAYMWATYGDTNKGGSKQTFRNLFGDPTKFTSKDEFKNALYEKFTPQQLEQQLSGYKSNFADNLWGARTAYLTNATTNGLRPSIPSIGGVTGPGKINVSPGTPNFFTPNTTTPGTPEQPAGPGIPAINDPNPVTKTTTSGDPLQFNIPDTLALGNSLYNLGSIPKIYPRRYENYGIPQAQSILANVKPYDYQSQINEVNKTLSQSAAAVNTFSRTPQQQAAVVSTIYGQGLEATSRIRGAEYNANAQLYNQNAAQLAQYAVARGEDLSRNAQAYNQSVDTLNQNFYEDKLRARNSTLQTFANAYSNAVAVNSENQLNPNYKINPFTLQVEYKAPNYNPLTAGNSNNYFSPVSTIANYANQISQVADTPEERKVLDQAGRMVRRLPLPYQQQIFRGQYYQQ